MTETDKLIDKIRGACEPDEKSGWLEIRFGYIAVILRASIPAIQREAFEAGLATAWADLYLSELVDSGPIDKAFAAFLAEQNQSE